MELAVAVFFLFLVAVVLTIIAFPLMVISRIIRMLKNSYAKLFKTQPKKA